MLLASSSVAMLVRSRAAWVCGTSSWGKNLAFLDSSVRDAVDSQKPGVDRVRHKTDGSFSEGSVVEEWERGGEA
jgi:hypothetical protein